MVNMNEHMPDQLDRLPNELKSEVAHYVTELSERKALVLVNKAWAEIILPHLWNTLTTDLLQTGQRNVRGLAHANSNIIKHVSRIHLLTRSCDTKVDHLPALLAAIPRGQLRTFKSISTLQTSTVNLLLLLHSNLEELELPLGQAFANAIQSEWTTGCFSNITSATVFVDTFSCEGLQKLWTECPKLTQLSLGATKNGAAILEDAFLSTHNECVGTTGNTDDATCSKAKHLGLRLAYLWLGGIALPVQLDTMFRQINILTLSTLWLGATVGASRFLEAMAMEFTKGQPNLQKLNVRMAAIQTPELATSLLLLLNSFYGLKMLTIHRTDCDKIDVDSLVHHGETLETLSIVNGGIHRRDVNKCFDASDMQKIATGCPNIRQLCLNLYEIAGDENEDDILGPRQGVPYTPNEFEQALTAIAGMPKLRILRFTNPPNYRKAYFRNGELARFFHRNLQMGLERYSFQARADGIMRYLGEHGSDLKALALSPIGVTEKVTLADKHGHTWPHYYYYRGRMTDHKGTDVAIARPLRSWKDECPDALVLEDV
ncbi:hypothetical protein HBH98_011040 [Parastagonospora nodorum]|nr:hypothetical protein HBH46_113080 [Parastagonospora nodorum]KAH4177897.1 hypothetical protein HBH43_037770 [Parastagonospora nodorum]KAH4353820.1 hypothetical protein HBH98_011040 [Parastagonospora nodorum]KAH4397485.1 hypothetical protein HBH97_003900 [Parastagonospora nodorum]KAH4430049.1 hypothetical protein HBH99_011100 [Parastagonospora nodorum]